MMHSDVAAEIWQELRRFIGGGDRGEAADVLVSILINADEDPEDIRSAFRNDRDIRRALQEHMDTDQDQDPDEYEEDYVDGADDLDD
jgi:hypothetical protein